MRHGRVFRPPGRHRSGQEAHQVWPQEEGATVAIFAGPVVAELVTFLSKGRSKAKEANFGHDIPSRTVRS